MTDLDQDSKQLIALSRAARTPTAADKARLERRIATAVAVSGAAAVLGSSSTAAAKGAATVGTAAGVTGPAATTTGAAVAGKSALAGLGAKWILGGALALGAAGGSYVALRGEPAPSAKSVTEVAPVQVVAPAPEVPAPQVEDTAEIALPQPTDAPARRKVRRERVAEDSLGEELSLLHEARVAWQGRETAKAMRLLEMHRKRFPRSELFAERDALRVLSLCDLGQVARARHVAKRFLKSAPASPLRATVEESCAVK